MGAEGAANIIFRGNPDLPARVAEYKAQFANPLAAGTERCL